MKPDPQTGMPFQPPLLPVTHRNQHLFSDHYLNSLLPERDEWRALAAEAGPVMQRLQAILAAYVPSENEAQTEEGLVKPVLYALGHTFEVQASLETPYGAKRPDHVFYRDLAALAANRGKKLDESLLLGRALAVGDAKYWNRPLDVSLKRAGGDPFDNKNPFQPCCSQAHMCQGCLVLRVLKKSNITPEYFLWNRTGIGMEI